MNRTRPLMILLLLLALVGQSMAAVAVPCRMMGSAGGDSAAAESMATGADMAGMAHTGHHMSPAGMEQQPGDTSCCDSGFCSMSHCQSVVALPQTHLPGAPAWGMVQRDFAPVASLAHPTYSLFRPPIFR